MSDMVKGEPQTDAPLASASVRTNLDALNESDVESLRVRAQTTPGMTVAVEDDNNRAYVDANTALDYAGGNSPSFTAPLNASEKQIDILTLDKDGVLAITSGTPTTGTPTPPTYPTDKMVLAEIFLRNGMASIKNTDDATNGYIFKARTPVFNLGIDQSTIHNVPYIRLHDSKATTTAGGTFTSGAWRKRTITEEQDTNDNVSVASSVITLEAGTYDCLIVCPVYAVDNTQARLRNTSDNTTEILSQSTNANNTAGAAINLIMQKRFTIAAQKTFEIQNRCQTTKTVDGFSRANSFGENEIYTVAEFWKVL